MKAPDKEFNFNFEPVDTPPIFKHSASIEKQSNFAKRKTMLPKYNFIGNEGKYSFKDTSECAQCVDPKQALQYFEKRKSMDSTSTSDQIEPKQSLIGDLVLKLPSIHEGHNEREAQIKMRALARSPMKKKIAKRQE
ncbi:Hypothetical_protein [Hexamita inflata]|uniref:Hypothetical_protein n=1 Tax=Hexamita inflata TaxID=28002 RepID=A0AA86TFC2_9EUKA|nr:Hypothetical protein HINF_LOCUS3780 [Hexamita inflata]